jgi:7-cyano-7-deazaguanine synthase
MHKPKTAVMVTGGIDSTTLLHMTAHLNPTPVTVDYGHDAFGRQVEMLQPHIDKLGLPPLEILKVEFPKWQRREGLFTPGYESHEVDPLNEWDKLRYEEFFIEGRNATMVLAALAWCSAHKVDELLAGYLYAPVEWEKRRTYKLMTGDNSPQFVDTMNMLTNVGFSHQVRFRAPFYELRWGKDDVIAEGKRLGVDFSSTHSCYFVPACGKCDNCLLRAEFLGA